MEAIVKKLIRKVLGLPNKIRNYLTLKWHKVEISKNVVINGKIVLQDHGHIILEEGVRINCNFMSAPAGGKGGCFFSVSKNACLKIGKNSGISNTSITCRNSITIGDNVKIGAETRIYDTDFHSIDYLKRRDRKDDIGASDEIIIEDDAFIGTRSMILKGVHIGARSVIGAGSTVTKNVPPDEIWAGVPARFIRKL